MVAVCEGLRDEVTGYYELPRDSVRTIYNFFDLGGIRGLSRETDGAPLPRAPFILGCGRLVEMKALDDLIEGFALVRRRARHRELKLVILGEGPREHGVAADVDDCSTTSAMSSSSPAASTPCSRTRRCASS